MNTGWSAIETPDDVGENAPKSVMTNTVLTFALSDLVTGARRFALICPAARYASIASRGGDRLERRFVNPADWHLLASAMTLGLEPGQLPADHIVSRILIDERQRKATTAQFVSFETMTLYPATSAIILDAHLRAMASRAGP